MHEASFPIGVRTPFADLPADVLAWVEDQLGGPVIDVRDTRGGFSPGATAVVRSAARSGFVKAVGNGTNDKALTLARLERDVHRRLPDIEGILRPLAETDLEIGDESWSAMLFPALEGAPPRHPWGVRDVERVLAELERTTARLTPSPWPADDVSDGLRSFLGRWTVVADTPDDPWHRDRWVAEHLDGLLAAETELVAALPGDTLCHTDLRADNIVLTADRVWFIDWAHARTAADWLDPLMLCCDLIASGADRADGGEIDLPRLLAEHPCLTSASPQIRTAMIGAMHVLAQGPDVPGLPTIRGWQRLTADRLLTFLKRQTG